jgi:hypothetical protein
MFDHVNIDQYWLGSSCIFNTIAIKKDDLHSEEELINIKHEIQLQKSMVQTAL